jgi:hypothetical protein
VGLGGAALRYDAVERDFGCGAGDRAGEHAPRGAVILFASREVGELLFELGTLGSELLAFRG